MSPVSTDSDPAFAVVGKKSGLDIWCIEDLQLVPVARSSYGKFYSGSAYVVLNTTLHKSGSFHYDIHYWLGSDANKENLEAASNKALELDHFLGSCAVQYREVQGQETEKFLSYFKPCIIPLEGAYCSHFGLLKGEGYHISLFACKGEHAVRVKEVPFARSSLNHDDVLILDTASKIFLFSGCNSSIQERAKALEVVQFIKDNRHNGKCEVATVEDGKLVGHADVGEFWSFFGGYTPISRNSESAFNMPNIGLSTRMYRISTQGALCEVVSGNLDQEMLKSDQCYMLDSDNVIFVWMGRSMSTTERKTAISAAEDFLRDEERSGKTHVTLLTEGLETANFRSFFVNWPEKRETKLYEEGREKVAAMFKRHGYDVKELPEEECDPTINSRGTLKVFIVNNGKISLLEVPEPIKLYSGHCYLVQYTYSVDGKDETLLYAWFGSSTSTEDRADVISCMVALADSNRGSLTLAQVFQDNEPEQFFQILQTVIIKKGYIEEKIAAVVGIHDDYSNDVESRALFRVQGRSPSSLQAVQVDPVSRTLNSSYCYILQMGSAVWSWIGTLSSARDHELLDRMIELMNPLWQPVSVREGNEPDMFWEVLGGKGEYSKEKVFKQGIEDPHLFKTTLTEGDLKVEEIYNFTQGDLTTEDVLVLSCPQELYVWIGFHSNITTKETAFTLGQKFLKMDVLLEGLNPKIPTYIVTEGHEPSFFTRFFSWDPSKANMHGNSFERKLAMLKGNPQFLEFRRDNTHFSFTCPKDSEELLILITCEAVVHTRSSWTANSRTTTPDSLRSSPISSNGQAETRTNFSNLSPSVTSSRQWLFSSPTATVTRLFSGSSPQNGCYGSPMSQLKSNENTNAGEVIETDPSISLITYPYERLKILSEDPVTDIDVTRRESYLSEEEFQEKLGMTKAAFSRLPKWRRDKLKMSVHLF